MGIVHRNATAGRKNSATIFVSHVNVLICSPDGFFLPLPVAPGFSRTGASSQPALHLIPLPLPKDLSAVPHLSLVSMPTSHTSCDGGRGPEASKTKGQQNQHNSSQNENTFFTKGGKIMQLSWKRLSVAG